MEYRSLFSNNDALGMLLKENRPKPNQQYEQKIAETLWSIRMPERKSIRAFAIGRHLAFAALIVLILALGVGTAFAMELLFRNVFGNASSQIEERINEAQEQYPAIRDGMEDMTEEEAVALDMKMGFEATNDSIIRSIMESVARNAGIVGQQDESGLILSEFSIYDTNGIVSTDIQSRHMYIGFAYPSEQQVKTDGVLYVDGYRMTINQWDVPLLASDTERYAIYECIPNHNKGGLGDTSLFTVVVGDSQFCFRYNWLENTIQTPKDTLEKEKWVLENEALHQKRNAEGCVCLNDTITLDGITITVTDVSVKDNILRVVADVTGFEALIGKKTITTDMEMTIKGYTYRIGIDLFVNRILPDDFGFSGSLYQKACWEFTLPFHASELVGEEFNLHFKMKTRDQSSEWQPEYDYVVSSFKYCFVIN